MKNRGYELAEGYIAAAVGVISIPIFLALGIDGEAVTYLAMAVIFAVWIALYLRRKNKSQECAYYDKDQKTLYLKKRNKTTQMLILLKRFYKEGATFKPAEIVYTGMTVGGVSVGSAKVNDAHYESYGIKTDKFLMYYEDESKPIEKIVYENTIPQNSVVKKFCINENTILIMSPTAMAEMTQREKLSLANSIISGNKTLEMMQIGDFLEKKFLTYSECNTIKSWVGGKID